MADINIRIQGRAGRITLTRPKLLNAVSYQMCLDIEAALKAWRDDDQVALVIIDAEGEKAFSAGGDIQKMYETGQAGDYSYGRQFWRDEYRLNAMIADYPKPYVAFMQGFTMGGGVGISCHGSHRVVGDSSKIAMPECGIGLVPDVGGSLLLARAPGHVGEYLGLTAARMGAEDAIYAGFADYYLPEADWAELIATLEETGDAGLIANAASAPPAGKLLTLQTEIDTGFGKDSLSTILEALRGKETEFTQAALKGISRNSPLSMAATVEIIHQVRQRGLDIHTALELEYRFTHRAMEHGDFIEGIRAQVIDKDQSPKWQHGLDEPLRSAAAKMLEPLGDESWTYQERDAS